MQGRETAVYPTIVLGRGEVSAQVLRRLTKLLNVHRSPARHVVAVGTTDGVGYDVLHQPQVHTSEPFINPLSQWMHAIRSEENLSSARKSGLSIGPPGGYLLVQVLLLVDSNYLADVPAVVEELRQASARSQEELPVRLYLLVLHASHDLSTLRWQENGFVTADRWLAPCGTWLVGLTRSDGSNITGEQLVETLSYLLLAAVQTPSQAEEHWLFRSPAYASGNPMTLGFGFLVLPLAEIEQALTDKLVADTLQPLLEEPEEPPPLPPEVTPEEGSWWQTLLSKLPGLVSAGAGLTLSLLRQETPPIGNDPRRWLQEADDWDARWQQETLPKWRESLQGAADDLLGLFHSKMHEEFSRYCSVITGFVPLLSRLTNSMIQGLEKWSILKMEMPGLPTESLQTARAQFESALQQLPIGAGIAWLHYRRRRRELGEAWQVYTQHLQAYHAAQMRLAALEVLRESAEKLQSIIHQQAAHTESLARHVTGVVTLRQAAALGLRIMLPPWIRAVVTAWKHLQPVAQELWGHRDLRDVLRRRVEKEAMTTPEEWLKGIDRVANDLRDSLIHHWMTPQHRRLTYYLRQRFGSEQEAREWLERQMDDLRNEASCLLWRSAKPPLQGWQFMDAGLPQVQSPALSAHGDSTILVPDMAGRVCTGEAWLESG